MERRQRSVVGTASHRAGVRSEIRPHAGRSLSPRGGLSALAARQASGRLHLRSVGGYDPLRAREGLRRVARRPVTPSADRTAPPFGASSDRAAPVADAILPARARDSRECASTSEIVRAWHRPARRRDADARRHPDDVPAIAPAPRARRPCAVRGQFPRGAGSAGATWPRVFCEAGALRRRRTAARVRARRAAFDNAAATAHHPDPHVPVALKARAGGRASTGVDRSRHGRRRGARSAAASRRA